jgi:hypothetical protein
LFCIDNIGKVDGGHAFLRGETKPPSPGLSLKGEEYAYVIIFFYLQDEQLGYLAGILPRCACQDDMGKDTRQDDRKKVLVRLALCRKL